MYLLHIVSVVVTCDLLRFVTWIEAPVALWVLSSTLGYQSLLNRLSSHRSLAANICTNVSIAYNNWFMKNDSESTSYVYILGLGISAPQALEFFAQGLSARTLGASPCAWVSGASLLLRQSAFASTVAAKKENCWHRKLRSQRSKLRTFLQQSNQGPLGKRKRKSVRRAIWKLQGHHATRYLDFSLFHRTVYEMTWFCRPCQQNNPQTVDQCRVCGKHWTKVWIPKQTSRSQSRGKKAAEKKKAKDKQEVRKAEASTAGETGIVLMEKVPWVNSTPLHRLHKPKNTEKIDKAEPDTDAGLLQQQEPEMPPQATDSSNTMTKEEIKLLEHLKTSVEMGMELSVKFQQQYQILLQKEKEANAGKALSHGHIHRLRRLKAQTNAAGQKIKNLDSEWKKLVTSTQEKLAHHAKLYQSCRAEMMEAYNMKMQEWQNAKMEINTASQSLMAEELGEEPQEAPEVDLQVASVIQDIEQAGQVFSLLSDDEQEAEVEVVEDQEMDVKQLTRLRRSFQGSPSPTKVATSHLKTKHKGAWTKSWMTCRKTGIFFPFWMLIGMSISLTISHGVGMQKFLAFVQSQNPFHNVDPCTELGTMHAIGTRQFELHWMLRSGSFVNPAKLTFAFRVPVDTPGWDPCGTCTDELNGRSSCMHVAI